MSGLQRRGSTCWRVLLLLAFVSATPRGQALTSADPAPRDGQQQAADTLLSAHDGLQQAHASGSAGDADQCRASGSGGAASPPPTSADPALSPQPAPSAAGTHPDQPGTLEQAHQHGGATPGSRATAEASGHGAGTAAVPGQHVEAPAAQHDLSQAQGTDEAAGQQQPLQSQPHAAGQPAPEALADESAAADEQQQNFALAKDGEPRLCMPPCLHATTPLWHNCVYALLPLKTPWLRHPGVLSGAKVLATNKEAKKAPALLDDDSDTFLKNDCRADK